MIFHPTIFFPFFVVPSSPRSPRCHGCVSSQGRLESTTSHWIIWFAMDSRKNSQKKAAELPRSMVSLLIFGRFSTTNFDDCIWYMLEVGSSKGWHMLAVKNHGGRLGRISPWTVDLWPLEIYRETTCTTTQLAWWESIFPTLTDMPVSYHGNPSYPPPKATPP